MSNIELAVACAALGSVAAAGGYCVAPYLNVPEPTDDDKLPPPGEPSATTFSETESLDPVYQPNLLGLTKASNLPKLVKPLENKEWWEWSFKVNYLPKRFITNKLNSLFQNVTLGFSNDDVIGGLNKACNDAYKQNKVNYAPKVTNFLLRNIGNFCTAKVKTADDKDISEPRSAVFATAQTGNDYKDGVLKVADNAKHLVKPTAETSNDLWWEWAYKKLYSPFRTTASTSFRDLNTGFSSVADSGTVKALNNACDAAYKDSTNIKGTNAEAILNDIKRFCSNTQAPVTAPT